MRESGVFFVETLLPLIFRRTSWNLRTVQLFRLGSIEQVVAGAKLLRLNHLRALYENENLPKMQLQKFRARCVDPVKGRLAFSVADADRAMACLENVSSVVHRPEFSGEICKEVLGELAELAVAVKFETSDEIAVRNVQASSRAGGETIVCELRNHGVGQEILRRLDAYVGLLDKITSTSREGLSVISAIYAPSPRATASPMIQTPSRQYPLFQVPRQYVEWCYSKWRQGGRWRLNF
jgi:hypothetical protein